jgi:RimJ/RimL family protein N-acetyltransferase
LEEIETADLIDHLDRLFADGAARASMADRGGLLVDGEGAERVAMKLTGDRVRLRRARPGDCERVFVWANDPDTRKASFSSAPIPWEDHTTWFHKSLHNPNRLFFIAVDEEDRPAGFIRFDAENRDAVLSIAVAPEARGAGFGSELVLLGTKKLFDAAGCDAIHAYVKPDNAPSARLFQKTGFTELAETTVSGNRARHFVLKRGIIGA